jgi:hypothetical protein
MKVQTIINGWSVIQTGAGVACKYMHYDHGSEYEVCLSFADGEVRIEVHQDGVDAPVAVINLEGEVK